MEESAKGGSQNRKSGICSGSVPSPAPLQRRWGCLGGKRWGGGGGCGGGGGSGVERGRKSFSVGNPLSAGGEEPSRARAAAAGSSSAVPPGHGGLVGPGALRVGLRALGGESSAGRGQCPPARAPAEEQPAAVPGSWPRPGNAERETGRRPRGSAGRGARSWTRRGDVHRAQKRRRTFIEVYTHMRVCVWV